VVGPEYLRRRGLGNHHDDHHDHDHDHHVLALLRVV
jgi:hypothetical protein